MKLFFKSNEIYDLKISPNPGNNRFNVNLITLDKRDATLVIIDMPGKKVMEYTVTSNKETDINLSMPKGIYFISTTTSKAD